jgi:hypothetical protein
LKVSPPGGTSHSNVSVKQLQTFNFVLFFYLFILIQKIHLRNAFSWKEWTCRLCSTGQECRQVNGSLSADSVNKFDSGQSEMARRPVRRPRALPAGRRLRASAAVFGPFGAAKWKIRFDLCCIRLIFCPSSRKQMKRSLFRIFK